MTYTEVYEMISSIGLPCAYNHFPKNTEQSPPFICFLYGDRHDLLADDTNYSHIQSLSVELYTDNKDFTIENTVEETLNNNGLVYQKSEEYLESEYMYMIIYDTEFVLTEEEETNGE